MADSLIDSTKRGGLMSEFLLKVDPLGGLVRKEKRLIRKLTDSGIPVSMMISPKEILPLIATIMQNMWLSIGRQSCLRVRISNIADFPLRE